MLHSSTEAKWSPHDCFLMKISEMDRSKQTGDQLQITGPMGTEAESVVLKNLTKWRSMSEHILKNIVLLTKRVHHQEYVSTLFKLFL